MDSLTPGERSRNMSRIRGKNTRPELAIRRVIHGMGYRYRLHRRDLPGTPDIVLPGRRRIFMVHGCFWHRHPGCTYAYNPKSRVAFWTRKFKQNVSRDKEVMRALRQGGWGVMVIWECELKDVARLKARLSDFVDSPLGGSRLSRMGE